MRITNFLLLIFSSICLTAQDTLQLMHYNLLNYRNSTTQCTGSTNDPSLKDANLKVLFKEIKADIITCNEIGANIVNASRILDNALNTDGINHYDQAQYSNNGFSSLTNMLFYNKNKFTLYGQDIIYKDLDQIDLVRVIDVYKLYLNSGVKNGDTVRLHVVVAHLKAGNTSNDQIERDKMTMALMDYLLQQKERYNYIFSGDFNVQSSSEKAYQNLINHSTVSIRFYDPVDAPGNWNNNNNYANLHTQSTRSSSSNVCFSSGGMDDRYDFTLASDEIVKGSLGLKLITGSYKAYGNDGGRFNSDINGLTNKALPQNILDALYQTSDHIPVLLQLSVFPKSNFVRKDPGSILSVPSIFDLSISIQSNMPYAELEYHLINIYGQIVSEGTATLSSSGRFNLNTENLNGGYYYLTLTENGQYKENFKLLKLTDHK
ncbi:MAG: hypothetical protein H6605_06060 [Flavobacteriales bacterium]|nr:hypothetical protein [Flavobacteriales bacterium]